MRNAKSSVEITAMWVSTAVAIVFTVFVTRTITPLWFFLIPLVGSAYTISKQKEDNDGKD